MKYIITGTSSGLGYEISKKLLTKGDIIGISRTLGKAKLFENSKSFSHVKFNLDNISNKFLYNQLITNLKKKIKNEKITLILNASIFYLGDNRLSYNKTNKLFNINVFSLSQLIESLTDLNLCRIFVINSISGIIGQENQHEYVASKHAVMGYIKSLIKSAKNKKFDVMCINPGGIKTDLWKIYPNVKTNNFIEVDELARICVSLISSKHKLFIENMNILPEADI
jgi:3-oxoacyl-[acyl-carrier protein] reductase